MKDKPESTPTAIPELCRLSLSRMSDALAAGTVSCEELTRAHLDLIARGEPLVRAFITVTADQALAAARDADSRRQAGDVRRWLGVPYVVKDVIDVAGLVTTQGAAWRRAEAPAVRDALPVARLRAAGFVLLGKTNTPEFGFGAQCLNGIQGPTASPLELSLCSGGSSGGSAAAVSACMAPVAHGADFGGSVRTPAAFCGVVGLRPTPGRIADPDRALAFDSLSTHGVLARSVDDAAAFLALMAGPDLRDPVSLGCPPEPRAMQVSGLRVGFTADFGVAPVARQVRKAFSAAVTAMSGVWPVSEATPDCAGAMQAFATLRGAVIRHNLKPYLDGGAPLSETARWNAMRGESLSAADCLSAQAARARVYRSFVQAFQSHDVFVTPAAAVMPFDHQVDEVRAIDGHALSSIIDYLGVTSIVSLIGLPALVVPFWTPGQALPIGLQLLAPPGEEARLIAFGRLLETHLDCRWRLPAAFDNALAGLA